MRAAVCTVYLWPAHIVELDLVGNEFSEAFTCVVVVQTVRVGFYWHRSVVHEKLAIKGGRVEVVNGLVYEE